jgi:hypothetical protein
VLVLEWELQKMREFRDGCYNSSFQQTTREESLKAKTHELKIPIVKASSFHKHWKSPMVNPDLGFTEICKIPTFLEVFLTDFP